MATRCFARSLFTTKQSLSLIFSHSYATGSAVAIPNSSSFLFRLRPLVAAVSTSYFRRFLPVISTRALSTRDTNSSLNDPNPNWSNRPPKETILLDGCDFEHWLVVMDPPEGDITRDDIIDSYIKTLAQIIGSEEEARMKIYSVSTRHYFAFGALVSEEMSCKIKELPKVRWVLPDSYLDVKNKDYGGEPFVNGQAVPYDPKYHEEWVRNNSRAQDRNRRNDRPRNNDRSRNYAPRSDMQGQNGQGGQPNMPPPPPGNAGPRQPNYVGGPPPNNPGNYPANNMRGPGPNTGVAPYQPGPGPNQGGFPSGPVQGQYQNARGNMGGQGQSPYQNQNYPGRDSPSPPNQRYAPAGGQTTVNFDPSVGYGNHNTYAPQNIGGQGQYGNTYAPQQNNNAPGRDYPPSSNY